MNELIFFIHTIFICTSNLIALWAGKEVLIALVALQSILANLFVLKTTTFWGLTVTGGDAFIIGIVFSLQMLQEYYGKQMAQRAIWTSFGLLLFYTITTQIILWYAPNASDFAHAHFAALLSVAPRIGLASLLAYITSTQFDCFFYQILKERYEGNYLVARNIGSASISQLLDTILFSVFGLYGIVSNVLEIMAVSYIIKLLGLLLCAPFIVLTKKIIKPELIKEVS